MRLAAGGTRRSPVKALTAPYCATRSAGRMNAPKIQRIGKNIPKKNSHPCRFLSVITPSVTISTRYKIAAPIPIPHNAGPAKS